MPQFCAAFGCHNRRYRYRPNCEKNLSFHRFPLKDTERLKKWLIALKRENFVPTQHSVLCSEHFDDEHFEVLAPHHNRRFLRNNVVPSKFSFSKTRLNRKRTSYQFGSNSVLQEPVNDTSPTHAKTEGMQTSKNIIRVQVLPNKINEITPIANGMNEEIHQIANEHLNEKIIEGRTDVSPVVLSGHVSHNLDEVIQNPNNETQPNVLPEIKQEVSSDISTDDEETNFDGNESAEILKLKLEKLSARYKKVKIRLKEARMLCNMYTKENSSLKEVLDSLRQIISVSNDN